MHVHQHGLEGPGFQSELGPSGTTEHSKEGTVLGALTPRFPEKPHGLSRSSFSFLSLGKLCKVKTNIEITFLIQAFVSNADDFLLLLFESSNNLSPAKFTFWFLVIGLKYATSRKNIDGRPIV